MHADSVLGKVDSSRKLAFANGLIKIIILYILTLHTQMLHVWDIYLHLS